MRDVLLGEKPHDIDLVAEYVDYGFVTNLASDIGGLIVSKSEFGTSKIISDGIHVDLAMARKETYSTPGALPTISPGSISDDLHRRDFSINSIAISISNSSWGQILDPTGGQQDLRSQLIRVLHPKSFQDDATRILRTVRYATRLGFRISSKTKKLIDESLHYISTVSGDRIRKELQYLLEEKTAYDSLRLAMRLGILDAIHPSLGFKSMLTEEIDVTGEDSYLTQLSVLAFEIEPKHQESIIERFGNNPEWSRIIRDVAAIKRSSQILTTANLKPSQLYHLLHSLEIPSIKGCILASDNIMIRERLSHYLSELRDVNLTINGNDLISLGVPEGQRVGELLKETLNARLDGFLSTRQEEEDYILRKINLG